MKKTKQDKAPRCVWTYAPWDDLWNTDCGKAFTLLDGSPLRENDMRFCCYCGKALKEKHEDANE